MNGRRLARACLTLPRSPSDTAEAGNDHYPRRASSPVSPLHRQRNYKIERGRPPPQSVHITPHTFSFNFVSASPPARYDCRYTCIGPFMSLDRALFYSSLHRHTSIWLDVFAVRLSASPRSLDDSSVTTSAYTIPQPQRNAPRSVVQLSTSP